MATLTLPRTDIGAVIVAQGAPEDNAAAEALWKSTGARVCPGDQPAVRLIARDSQTRRFLGVGDCFRTFPPEDAMGAVAVLPSERRHGVGTALLRALANAAREQGKRKLVGFMTHDDTSSWYLLRSAGMLVRMRDIEVGLYVELDLLSVGAQNTNGTSLAD